MRQRHGIDRPANAQPVSPRLQRQRAGKLTWMPEELSTKDTKGHEARAMQLIHSFCPLWISSCPFRLHRGSSVFSSSIYSWIFGAPVLAQDSWNLVTADFQSKPVTLLGMTTAACRSPARTANRKKSAGIPCWNWITFNAGCAARQERRLRSVSQRRDEFPEAPCQWLTICSPGSIRWWAGRRAGGSDERDRSRRPIRGGN